MITIATLAIGALAATAVVLIAVTVTAPPRTVQPARRARSGSELWAVYTRRPLGRAGVRRDLTLAAGLVGGVLAFALTGWIVLIVVVPLGVVLAPKLLGQAPPTDVPLLEALDRWIRSMATIVTMGHDVVGTLRLSRSTTPDLLTEPVAELVGRIDRGVPAAHALQQFADELDSPESDAIIASLILATHHTQGLGANLIGVADACQQRLTALRQVETQRSSIRQSARMTTILSVLIITAATIVLGDAMAPYTTPIGQLLLAVLIAAYLGSMLLLYQVSRPRRRARILIPREGATR